MFPFILLGNGNRLWHFVMKCITCQERMGCLKKKAGVLEWLSCCMKLLNFRFVGDVQDLDGDLGLSWALFSLMCPGWMMEIMDGRWK